MRILCIIATVLLIIGGLNWGLVGLANIDLVKMLFGGTGIDRVVYILVGLSAILEIVCFKQVCSKTTH